MHADLYSLQAERFMKILRPLLPDTPQGEILSSWDFVMIPDHRELISLKPSTRNFIAKYLGRTALVKLHSIFSTMKRGPSLTSTKISTASCWQRTQAGLVS